MTETPSFPQTWSAEILRTPPLIAPARSFIYPQSIAGEEDALARGALHLLVRPRLGGSYLITCALGFTAPSMPTGVFSCPNPDELCAVAGGYAYLSNTTQPESCSLLPLKPVAAVQPLPGQNLLLFLGFHTILAWGPEGKRWQTGKLTWEGLRVTEVTNTHLHGLGWDLLTDREVPFTVDLASGSHTGGPFPADSGAPASS